jgi:peptidoglycan/xylan/chitin deacetylase (PgdA/CDA1 family)
MRTTSAACPGIVRNVGAVATLAPFNWAFGCGGVVAYHDVTQTPFAPSMHISVHTLAEQLAFLASARYRIIPLSELIERRRSRRSVRRCVALTFDDAYHGVLEFALPLLQRFGVPATVFVATAYARRGARYWWDRLTWVLERADPGVVAQVLARASGLSDASPHETRAGLIASSAGRLSADAEAAITDVERTVGVVPERPLSESELGELARTDLIEFGCHTESHPALPALPPDAQRREISSSHAWLAERLPRVRSFLAYPYGLYDRTTVQAARDVGMTAAFSIEGRAAGPRFDLYACPRIGIAEVNSLHSVALRLSWLTRPLVAWRNGGWHPRMPRTARPVGQR